jgi:hypothetical protein
MADGIGIRFEYQAEIPEVTQRSSDPGSLGVATLNSVVRESESSAFAWIEFPESSDALEKQMGL